MKVTNSHRQAILTRYLGPTNFKGSRIVAAAQAGRAVISYDYGLNLADNHAQAVTKLAAKLGWDEWTGGQWVGGQLPNGDCSFVWAEDEKED